MPANSARKISSPAAETYPHSTEASNNGFAPRAVNALHFGSPHDQRELRAYTEEQVADMLQVSRSQLRKWRMGWTRGRREGPPFKKLGRIVRYPESGLRQYIYGP